jgi:cytochrome oxidase Cu insertion factor (SCO1/SenC/PrrC family)
MDTLVFQNKGGIDVRRFVVMILLIVISLLWNIPTAFAQFSEAGVDKFRVAVEAPDFTLKNLDGEKISLKELRGKIILLNYFTTW